MKKLFLFLTLIFIIIVMVFFIRKPSNNRNWNEDQKVLPFAEVEGDRIHIHNIRNTVYRTTSDYDVRYYDKTVDVNSIASLDYMVEPFSKFSGLAHTFLTFGFDEPEGRKYVAISVEIRKQKGQEFSAAKSIFPLYELMYVVADEQDVLKLRTNYRKDPVFLYPIKAEKEQIKKLFLSMIERANTLKNHPEFYNAITNTCTTNIVSHVNMLVPGRIPFSYKTIFPGYSDRLAYDLGLIDTTLSFEDARVKFKINELAEKYAEDGDFSNKVRSGR